MNNYGDQINQVINNLAEKLGIAVDKVYPMLRRQATLDGIQSFLWIIVGIFLAYCSYRILKSWSKTSNADKYFTISDDRIFVPKVIFLIVAGAIVLISVPINISIMFNAFGNPDYYILKSLIIMMK